MRTYNLRIWYLHVWAWTSNPEGMFANFQPDVKCPPATQRYFGRWSDDRALALRFRDARGAQAARCAA